MKTTKPLSRKSLKRSQPKRDWSAAREKVDAELHCRYCKAPGGSYGAKLEAAHVIGREHDRYDVTACGLPPKRWLVQPERIVPLCTQHHRAYDAHEIDLLPVLTLDEQVQAVIDADGIENARRRLAPSQYRSST